MYLLEPRGIPVDYSSCQGKLLSRKEPIASAAAVGKLRWDFSQRLHIPKTRRKKSCLQPISETQLLLGKEGSVQG